MDTVEPRGAQVPLAPFAPPTPLSGLTPRTSLAPPPPPLPRAPFRPAPPRLAFVIGSGGVRSAAALGAAGALAEHGIRPDLLVGCSSGALMGAVLALGVEPHAALAMARELWAPDLTERRRWRAWLELALPRLAGFGPDFAMRDARGIHRALERAFGDACLEALPVRLRVAVTDAASGMPLTLTHGPLVEALRASLAVPFLFPSVEVSGRRLVDGVLSDPLPVAAAADAEVLLTLGLEGAMPRRVDRASRLAAQATTTLINNLQEARLSAQRARGGRIVELLLRLERRVGLWEPAALPEVFDAGWRAGERALPQLRALLEGGGDRGDDRDGNRDGNRNRDRDGDPHVGIDARHPASRPTVQRAAR